MSEFHGVEAYYLLVPWLYHDLLFRRRTVWIPFLLILGIREDSGFFLWPMLLYFGLKERNRPALAFSAIAVLYAYFACYHLFQWINSVPLGVRRPGVSPRQILKRFRSVWIPPHPEVLFWIFVPVLPWLRRSAVPILCFPLVALLMVLWSPYPAQQQLFQHYGAAVMTVLAAGLCHAMICRQRTLSPSGGGWTKVVLSLWLIGATLFAHLALGYLPLGRRAEKHLVEVNAEGWDLLKNASRIPKNGVLITSDAIASFCANRRDLVTWERLKDIPVEPDLIFFTYRERTSDHGPRIREYLERGLFGIRFQDASCAIAERGFPTRDNDSVLKEFTVLRRQSGVRL